MLTGSDTYLLDVGCGDEGTARRKGNVQARHFRPRRLLSINQLLPFAAAVLEDPVDAAGERG